MMTSENSVYIRIAVGVLVALFFAIVLTIVIPAFVEKPIFIPGFAPGPDMWPRTIAVIGSGVGIFYVLFQISEWKYRGPMEGGWFVRTKAYWLRSFLSIAALICYIMLVPLVGIVLSSSALLAFFYFFFGEKTPLVWMFGLTLVFPFALYWLFTSVTTTLFPMGTLWESL